MRLAIGMRLGILAGEQEAADFGEMLGEIRRPRLDGTPGPQALLVELQALFGGGGGAEQSTLNSCLVISNSAVAYIGGVDLCTANNCTIVGNSSSGTPQSWGGGAGNSSLYNCILYYNTAPNAKMSLRASASVPCNCSGDAY